MHRVDITVAYDLVGSMDLEWLARKLEECVLERLDEAVDEFSVLPGQVTDDRRGPVFNAASGTLVLSFLYGSFDDPEYGEACGAAEAAAAAAGKEYDPCDADYPATEPWIIGEAVDAALDAVQEAAGWSDSRLSLKAVGKPDDRVAEQ